MLTQMTISEVFGSKASVEREVKVRRINHDYSGSITAGHRWDGDML